jgi:hypothetical protein
MSVTGRFKAKWYPLVLYPADGSAGLRHVVTSMENEVERGRAMSRSCPVHVLVEFRGLYIDD